MSKEKESKQPEARFSSGAVSTAVWENKGKKDGKEYSFNSVTMQRRYKDEDGNWKTADSLRMSDIIDAVTVLTEAYNFVKLKKVYKGDKE